MSVFSKLNLRIAPFKYTTDFVYRNKTVEGNNSIAEWPVEDEYPNRLQGDHIRLFYNDVVVIKNIKSLEYKTDIDTNDFTINLFGYDAGELTVYALTESGFELIDDYDIEYGYNIIDVRLDDYPNVESLILIAYPSNESSYNLSLYSDIDIQCFSTPVRVNVEGIDVGIDTMLKSYVTLANTIITSKISNTQFAYTSQLKLTHEQFKQLNDFLNLARLYKRKILVEIDVNEYVGNRVAGIPDISNTDFTLADLSTSETTGLYKYVTLTYFNTKNNKVR